MLACRNTTLPANRLIRGETLLFGDGVHVPLRLELGEYFAS